MCGIYGYMDFRKRGLDRREIKVLRGMAVAGTLRGWDGAGIFFREAGKQEVFFKKEPKTGAELMDKDSWEYMLNDNRFVVGHNRAATLGSINKENTHPFSYNGVTGVHNGTVHGWKNAFPDATATMDSMAIMEALGEADPTDEAASKVLSSLGSGAYALVWYDSRVHELRFARNDQRPLYFLRTPQGLYFASELRMAEWILSRHNVQIDSAWSLDTHRLVSIPTDRTAVRTLEYKPAYTSSYTSYGGGSYKSGGYSGSIWSDGWDDWRDNKQLIPHEDTPNSVDEVTVDASDIPYIDIVEWCGVEVGPVPHSTGCQLAGNMRRAIRRATGLDERQWPACSFDTALREYLTDSVDNAESTGLPSSRACVPMYVSVAKHTDVSNEMRLYGYIVINDIKEPCIVDVREGPLLDKVLGMIDDHVVLLDTVMIDNIRLYAQGDLSYVAVDVHSSSEFITASKTDIDLTEPEGQQIIWDFGVCHPDAVQDSTYAPSWEGGWSDAGVAS